MQPQTLFAVVKKGTDEVVVTSDGARRIVRIHPTRREALLSIKALASRKGGDRAKIFDEVQLAEVTLNVTRVEDLALEDLSAPSRPFDTRPSVGASRH